MASSNRLHVCADLPISNSVDDPEAVGRSIVVHEEVGCARIVHVFDDIDLSNAADFADELRSVAAGARIVIELSMCKYMDSSGLRVLIQGFHLCGERLRIVVAPSSSVDRVIRVTGLDGLLPIVPSLDEALKETSELLLVPPLPREIA